MKAVIFKAHGDIDQLKYEDVPIPEIVENEVLVKVEACALNHLDIWIRQGNPAYPIRFPHISGSDVAGKIAKVGQEVENLEEGMPVIIAPGLSCFKCDYCLSGKDNFCQSYSILGAGTDGGYAEYVKAHWMNIIPIPDLLPMEVAASFPLTFLTAWHMLISRANIQMNEWVLIHGAGSGVGAAAISIAKLRGAFVLATAGTDEKCEKAKSIGADEVVNYQKEDFSCKAKKINSGLGVDVVLDHIGQETWEKSLQSLAKGGRLVVCGATSGSEGTTNLRMLFSRQLNILGSMMGTRDELVHILELVKTRELKPTIDKVYSLQEAPQAQAYMIKRKNFGKIILKI